MTSELNAITVYVLDDEPIAVEIIESFVHQSKNLKLLGSSTDPVFALSELAQLKPDLLFLDVNMPEISGFDLLKILGDKKPLVIITSAHVEHAIKGYEFEVIDYLLKPIPYDDFKNALKKVKKRLQYIKNSDDDKNSNRASDIFIRADKENIRLRTDEISHIESFGDYVKIYRVGKGQNVIVARSTLSAMENELPSEEFLRVRRSSIVNISEIDTIKNHIIVLKKEIEIPIGKTYRNPVIKSLKKLTINS
ncbi:LytR/AlgR family response regulator transcription factor [Jiulongibacter sp. NS-SX5]|uniref:LytR/AlgR family response regulator transcription factor n=1 Tax=Jiulongibacter sp. NS-SX5 TaxID=3463854 RepID=UPI004058D90A